MEFHVVASLVGISIDIASSEVGLNAFIINVRTKKRKNKKQKAKSKLNTI